MQLGDIAFIERLVDGVTITELYAWQPYDMTIGRAKGSRIPSKYIWRKGQDGQMLWEVDPMTGQADLCHWKTFNPDPYDSSFGLSPLASAASSVDSYNSAMKLRYNRMKNGLSIDGILSPSGESNMTPEQQKQLENKLREKYTGPDGLRVAVSNQKMEFTTMTSTLKEAEWMDGTKLNKQEICEVYRVPTQLLGIENSMTYANYAEANISFFKQAVIPLADLWCSEMNRWLGDFFPGFRVAYNKSDLDALETLFTAAVFLALRLLPWGDRGFRTAWWHGFSDGIEAKLARERHSVERSTPGAALMLRDRRDRAEEEMTRIEPNLVWRSTRYRDSGEAYADGLRAGSQFSSGTDHVEGGRAALPRGH